MHAGDGADDGEAQPVPAGVADPVLAAGTLAVLGSVLAGRLILPGRGIGPAHGYPALSLADGPVLRAVPARCSTSP